MSKHPSVIQEVITRHTVVAEITKDCGRSVKSFYLIYFCILDLIKGNF